MNVAAPAVVELRAVARARPPAGSPTATDLFCGAGGMSTAATAAGFDVLIAANHWPQAIRAHQANLPWVEHACVDISQADPRRYPTTDLLICSPECTNHSMAKRRNVELALSRRSHADIAAAAERSRATMWDVPRWAATHRYKVIVVENVVDARKWGPDWDRRNGQLFDSWLRTMTELGYQHRILCVNSRFFNIAQSRDRMFVVLWLRELPAPNLEFTPPAPCPACASDVPAVQTFRDTPAVRTWGQWGRYGQQYDFCCPRCGCRVAPYDLPASSALDLALPALTVAERTRPLKDKTLRRIESGLDTHGDVPQLICMTHPGEDRVPTPLTQPYPTQTARQEYGVMQPAPGGGVSDCRLRMVTPEEIRELMGFPADYTLHGSKRARVRMLGNAVCPPLVSEILTRVRPVVAAPERERDLQAAA